jgi:hypothetical protein
MNETSSSTRMNPSNTSKGTVLPLHCPPLMATPQQMLLAKNPFFPCRSLSIFIRR